MHNHPALLLIGPTGSGKTPLGSYLAQRGVFDTRCFHFDFGEELRTIIRTGRLPSPLTRKDYDYIEQVLSCGALLENETFYIAEAILRSFISKNSITKNDLIILNGLPRHLGQAEDVNRIVTIEFIFNLSCSPEVLKDRIMLNTGKDRTGRTDDSHKEIENKIALFNRRTAPLLDFYKNRGVTLYSHEIALNTTPKEMYTSLR